MNKNSEFLAVRFLQHVTRDRGGWSEKCPREPGFGCVSRKMTLLWIHIRTNSELILKLHLSLAVAFKRETIWNSAMLRKERKACYIRSAKGEEVSDGESWPDELNFSRWLSMECRNVISEEYQESWFSPPSVEVLDEYNSVLLTEIMPCLSRNGWKNFVLISENLLLKHLWEKLLPFLPRKDINMDLLNIFRWAHVLIFFSKQNLPDFRKITIY